MLEAVVPFNQPGIEGLDAQVVAQAVRRGSGDGPFTQRCAGVLEAELGCARALLTPSCTHALELAAILLDIGPGDEVIVPSFTFVSTVNAFVLRGATPVFVDIRPDTLNLDETKLAAALTPRTKAIVPVHYAGVGCEMAAIQRIAEERGIPIVEDNAHGLWGSYRGKSLGTFGCLSTLSFHETKNIQCGEGGALVIDDRSLVDRAEIIREKGTNRTAFMKGRVEKYTWVDLGSSYLLSDLLAAVLLGQLESRDAIQAKRTRVWDYYQRNLAPLEEYGVQTPTVPPDCVHPAHLFYLLLPTRQSRQRLIDHLHAEGIESVFHYQPLHLSTMGRRFGGRPGQCPVTESVAGRLLRLPFFNDLTEETQARVVESIRRFAIEQRVACAVTV